MPTSVIDSFWNVGNWSIIDKRRENYFIIWIIKKFNQVWPSYRGREDAAGDESSLELYGSLTHYTVIRDSSPGNLGDSLSDHRTHHSSFVPPLEWHSRGLADEAEHVDCGWSESRSK